MTMIRRKLHWKNEIKKEDSFEFAGELMLFLAFAALATLAYKGYVSDPDCNRVVFAKLMTLIVVGYSGCYCLLTRTNGHYLVDMPRSYGLYRVWRWIQMAPAFPIPLASWYMMSQTKEANAHMDADNRKLMDDHVRWLRNLSPEERFPEEAKQMTAKLCRHQMELSEIPITPCASMGYIDMIEEMPKILQVTSDRREIAFKILAVYKYASKDYCLGVYELVVTNTYIGFRISQSFALANESRHDELERLDERLEKLLNERYLESLKRWFYTGRIDELVRLAVICVSDPLNFTDFDLKNIAERYPRMLE